MRNTNKHTWLQYSMTTTVKSSDRRRKHWNKWEIVMGVSLGVAHLMAFCALFYWFSWTTFLVWFLVTNVTGVLGLNFSYHRQLTHQSFKTPKWLEYSLAYCGALALQGDPLTWVSNHRAHHQHTDTEGDLHSPTMGFWYSHMNWIFDTSVQLPEDQRENAVDLEQQAFYRWMRKTYILHPLLLALLLYKFGGMPYLLWGMGFRVVYLSHGTWLVNSAGHTWGTQAWNTNDLSKNNWWVAMVSNGEGWHNNHHAFSNSARHGLEWWQIDTTWYAVKLFEAVGLVYDVELPTHKDMEKIKMAASLHKD